MRNLLLSAALIAAPVAVFAAAYTIVTPNAAETAGGTATAPAQGPSLGDMQRFIQIVSDTQAIAGTGDFTAAEKRITDFETAWDDAEPKLRPVNTAAWGNVDTAADAALDALRASAPDAASVDATLADLQAELADPSRAPGGAGSAAGGATVAGVATTDANGHPVPCEVMLDKLRSALQSPGLPDAKKAKATSLQAKGTERCNADDDKRADAFFAQGIALTSN